MQTGHHDPEAGQRLNVHGPVGECKGLIDNCVIGAVAGDTGEGKD
jgi:hypothetical protein